MSEKIVSEASDQTFETTEFKKKLENLLSFKLEIDTFKTVASGIDSYIEEIVSIIDTIRIEYKWKHPEVNEVNKQEDEGLKALGFGNVPNILEKMSNVKNILEHQIPNIFKEQILAVITPPDKDEYTIESEKGSGFEMNLESFPRLKMLLFMLINDCGLNSSDIDMRYGSITDTMMRREPYISVNIPKLHRLVFVCNEYGNRTDIFDTESEAYIAMNRDRVEILTKSEKDTFGIDNPGSHKSITYTKNWSDNLYSLLVEEISVVDTKRLQTKRPSTFNIYPRLNNDNFYIDSMGQRFGTAKSLSIALTGRLGLYNQDAFIDLLNGLEEKLVMNPPSLSKTYNFDIVKGMVQSSSELSVNLRKANEQGEWFDESGVRWATFRSILRSLQGTDYLWNDSSLVSSLSVFDSIDILSGTNKMKAYKFEDIEKFLAGRSEFKIYERTINNEGFYVDDQGESWGSKTKIADYISSGGGFRKNHDFAELLKSLSPLKIKGGTSSIKAYRLSDVISSMKAHPELSRWFRIADSQTGIYKDESGDEWGSPSVISKKLTGSEVLSRNEEFKKLIAGDDTLPIFVNKHTVNAHNIKLVVDKIKANSKLNAYLRQTNGQLLNTLTDTANQV